MKRQYLVTERAHFMCPNMHFGMQLKMKKPFNMQSVEMTLNRMAEAHPFLKSLIAYEEGTNRLYYHITDSSQIQLLIRQDENTMWDDYDNISKQEWDVMKQGLLKVFIYPNTDSMTILFIIHHLLVDGRGGLEIATEFANDYMGNIPPLYVEEQLIQSIEDLPEQSAISGINKFIIKQANRRWKKEKHFVSYETYLEFVKKLNENLTIKHKVYELQTSEVAGMVQLCHEHGITMNDYLMACMYQKANTKNIIIAFDIRNRIKVYRTGSYGNFATAMGIAYKGKTTDLVTIAKNIHEKIQKCMNQNNVLMLVLACYLEMNPTLLDAAAISALQGFQSKAGKFVGSSMFHMEKPMAYSITNLGRVDNAYMESLMFIPPASPAAKLTLGVVTLNGEMIVCSSEY